MCCWGVLWIFALSFGVFDEVESKSEEYLRQVPMRKDDKKFNDVTGPNVLICQIRLKRTVMYEREETENGKT